MPMSSVLAARPVATSMTSARISSVAPPSGPASTQTPSFVTCTFAASKRAFVMTLIPRRVKLFSTRALTSRSSSGTIAGRYSRRVTAVPMSWKKLANSTPTAPPPTMTMLFGASARRRMSSLVRIRFPSGVRPARLFTREPVARMMSVAWSRRSPPALASPSAADRVTRTRPGPSSRPRPWTQTTLFLSMRVLRPVHMRLTTWSRRAAICV